VSSRLPAPRDGMPPEGWSGRRPGRALRDQRGRGWVSEPDPHFVGALLRRRRASIVTVTLLVLAAVSVLTFFWPRTYKSSTTFLVERQGGHSDSPALDVLERLGTVGQIQTEINLLSSRSVVEPVVDSLALQVTVLADGVEFPPHDVFPEFVADRDAPAGAYRLVAGPAGDYEVRTVPGDSLVAHASAEALARFGGIGLRLPATLDASDLTVRVEPFPDAVAQTQGRITAALVNREADLVELTCKGSTPLAAQQVCDGISRSYIRLRTDLQRADAATTAAFLQDQVGRLGSQLAAVEDSIAAYSRGHQVVALDERASQETQQDIQVRAQRDQLIAEHDALSRLIRSIDSTPGGGRKYRDLAGYPALLKNDAVTGLLASLTELENRRVDLALRRTEQNVDLAAVDARIADIEQQLHAMATSYEQSLALQITSLDATQGALSRRLAAIPGEQIQTARLERERSSIEDVYKMLGTRLQEAQVAEAVRLPSVRIVDAASLPFRPSLPRVPLNLGLGLLMGLGFGVSLAVLREMRDSSLHERVEVERTVGLPILAMIPRIRRPGPVLPVFLASGRPSKRELRPERLPQNAQVTLDAFRALAVDLLFAGRRLNGADPVTIAVTSSTRGEGKTLTACNLAVTRASHGVRTLLIDADMRTNGVARFFRSPTPNCGLSDLLAGSADLSAVCTRLRVSGRETLGVIPAGTPTPHSAELLESRAMATLLEEARSRFDLVVIDTPPLNAITDAAPVAAMVDGIVLVVRGGVTDREALELTLSRLARVNGCVLGVVFNDARLPEAYVGRSRPGAFALEGPR
jgi:capsular exopolysaccharide synthesis family protein